MAQWSTLHYKTSVQSYLAKGRIVYLCVGLRMDLPDGDPN